MKKKRYESKYFKYEEFNTPGHDNGYLISDELLQKLDDLREACGRPIRITSGIRTKEYERKMGRNGTSSHCKGLACDIQTIGSDQRFIVLREALRIGFRRIGLGQSFIHLDIDSDKPEDIIWTYY